MNRVTQSDPYQDSEIQERVVLMSRVAKVVKGGRRFSFNALTVVGDSNSSVGVGFGKAKEVPEAIRKSIENGKKNMMKVKKQNATIPHQVIGKFKSATVLLKPGAPGTGIIAGEAVRAVVELGGIQDILTKRYGSSNKLNIVKATINALSQLSTFEEAKKRRGLSLPELFGKYSKKRRDEKRKELGLTDTTEKSAELVAATEGSTKNDVQVNTKISHKEASTDDEVKDDSKTPSEQPAEVVRTENEIVKTATEEGSSDEKG